MIMLLFKYAENKAPMSMTRRTRFVTCEDLSQRENNILLCMGDYFIIIYLREITNNIFFSLF